MGCCATKRSVPVILPKFELPSQEKVIANCEKLIPFSQKNSSEVEVALKANGTNGKLSVPQLKKTLGKLELDPTVFTDPDTQVFKFLTSMKNENKLYDLPKLSLCAILLGQGDTDEKAKILFEHFDEDASQKLEKNELVAMLEEMVDISVHKIPILALKIEGDTVDPEFPKITQEEIDGYVHHLLKAKHQFIDKVILKLLEGSDGIAIDDFVSKVKNDSYLARLVWSANIRVTLYEEAKSAGLV